MTRRLQCFNSDAGYVKVDDLAVKAKNYGDIQPLFITVDPLRDGVKEVKEYFAHQVSGLPG